MNIPSINDYSLGEEKNGGRREKREGWFLSNFKRARKINFSIFAGRRNMKRDLEKCTVVFIGLLQPRIRRSMLQKKQNLIYSHSSIHFL